jgi:hypothetical protein
MRDSDDLLMDEIYVKAIPVLIGEGIPFICKLVRPPVKRNGQRIAKAMA